MVKDVIMEARKEKVKEIKAIQKYMKGMKTNTDRRHHKREASTVVKPKKGFFSWLFS